MLVLSCIYLPITKINPPETNDTLSFEKKFMQNMQKFILVKSNRVNESLPCCLRHKADFKLSLPEIICLVTLLFLSLSYFPEKSNFSATKPPG